MNRQHVTLLVLLDLSAAFDTVDHNILLNTLKLKVGVSGKVLDWFSSYLLNRTQRVSINGTLSDSFELKWGVPQGSCLGPLLFVIYASKLFDITHVHLPNVHCYADDSQIYLSFKPDSAANQESAIVAIENCIKDIRRWMLADRLMLNDDKTEFLIKGTRQQLSKVNIDHIIVRNCNIVPVSVARNLGSFLYSKLLMNANVNKTCNSSFFHLRNIRRIRKYLSTEYAKLLVHAFFISHIDYCNSLLYGLPQTQLIKLQWVQNAAARLICNVSRFDHITPVLYQLHWLPVKFRIHFKLLHITFAWHVSYLYSGTN